MASPSLLPPFCQFLRHRLHTENLELFQRIVFEFLAVPRCFETVDTMVQLAFPLITILPIDNAHADQRARADALLTRMKQRRADVDPVDVSEEFAELRVALSAKIELKNWDWLEPIFGEFCIGDDYILQDFVALQRQAIAVVPLRSTESFRVGLPPPVHSHVAPSANQPSCVVLLSPAQVLSAKSPNFNMKKVKIKPPERRAVFDELLAIERQQPWEKVFNTATITYPFDVTGHPGLATDLKTFWTRHARAVWERRFWFQYGSPTNHADRQEDRKCRQDAATRFFEAHLIVRAYEALGPDFFVDLDMSAEKHYWWWYRGPVIDMLRLGSEGCIQYMRTNANERFPDPPPGLEFANHKHNPEKSSMWAALARYQTYRDAIAATKKARLAKKA